jgi:acyl carrier protein
MDDALERQVIDIIAQKKKILPEQVRPESTFAELGIDSLDGIELVFTFEDTFKITIPDNVAREMRSISQVVDGLRAALAGQAVHAGPETPTTTPH